VTDVRHGASAKARGGGAFRASRVVAHRARRHILTDSMATTLSEGVLDALAARLDRARLRRDEPLAPYTTFKIGGPADVLYDATSAEDLANAVLAARELGVPWFVLGLGANILIGDRGVRGVVIRNTADRFAFHDDGRLWVESGTVMARLIPEAVARGWSGFEHYVGIPSTVGGAIWQNLHFLSPAPARDRTMFIEDVFRSCELLTESGARAIADRAAMAFGYDTSALHHSRDVVLAVTFQLAPGDPAVMHRVMQENLSWRGSRHPWLDLYPSVGSIFKKIQGVGAGRLIDQLGLKGFRHGDAQISHVHANIVVNVGHATAKDVRELIAIVQAAVWQKFSQRLEPEIGFVGEF
jgi:UDP-N-acetylmuramate dehydrogenase